MGQHEEQKELFSYGVDLDRRVRAEHPLRRVQAMIDFTFARAAVAHTCGENGNVSVDPVVLLKLIFCSSMRTSAANASWCDACRSGSIGCGFSATASPMNHLITACSRKHGPAGAVSCSKNCSRAPCGSVPRPGWRSCEGAPRRQPDRRRRLARQRGQSGCRDHRAHPRRVWRARAQARRNETAVRALRNEFEVGEQDRPGCAVRVQGSAKRHGPAALQAPPHGG